MNLQYALPTNASGTIAFTRTVLAGSRRIVRRLRAVLRLMRRHRRARLRFLDLNHLDDRTLRDLGLTRSELDSVAYELGGLAAASRRRIDAESRGSASARFRTRAVDSLP